MNVFSNLGFDIVRKLDSSGRKIFVVEPGGCSYVIQIAGEDKIAGLRGHV